MTPILILAAGQSRRMRGRDKLSEDVAGEPLLRRQIRQACQSTHPVYVTLPHPDHPRLTCLEGFDVTPIFVPDAAEGMGVSLRTGIAALPDYSAVLVSLADLIGLTTADYMRLLQGRADYPDALIWRGAAQDGTPGHPILFDHVLRPGFAALTGDIGGAAILKSFADRVQLIPLPDDNATLDLDTPEDWDRWRATHP